MINTENIWEYLILPQGANIIVFSFHVWYCNGDSRLRRNRWMIVTIIVQSWWRWLVRNLLYITRWALDTLHIPALNIKDKNLVVISTGTTTKQLTFAFGRVVTIRSWLINDVTILRNIAHRWDDVLPSLRNAIRFFIFLLVLKR